MAHPKHLRILKRGTKAWNEWRKANSLVNPDLFDVELRWADLRLANLNGTQLSQANLKQANLREANLRNAILSWANLSEADLSGADLTKAELSQANLNRTNLREASLKGAILKRADFRDASFNGADLSGADLSGADLSGADLSGTDLSGANLSGVDLTRTNLAETNFSKAVVGRTTFTDVNLSLVKAIEDVEHHGPSSIGIDTIYRSRGKIPAQFLRGAGVPNNFIEYMGSLVGTAFEFYSCFISYSSKDQKFADRLFADLQKEGVRCWFAPHHAKAGEKLHEQIDTAIRLHERLLLILSPDSINSEWVKTEISKARKREIKEGRRVLFPIRLDIFFEQLQEWECFDSDRGKDSAREIREYYIPDFTGWKDHDKYEQEFKKLLRDLKKAASAATP